jgi:hypothetical protein
MIHQAKPDVWLYGPELLGRYCNTINIVVRVEHLKGDIMHEILWIPFIIASVAVISIPGQDMMLIMTKSISEGIGAGVCTA